MKITQRLTILSLFLFGTQMFGMDLSRIEPDSSMLERLVEFHEPTTSSGKPKPKIEECLSPNRRFVAKMDSFIADCYFYFSTNDHIDALVQAVYDGYGMGIKWFYYDLEEDENTISKARCPNVVVTVEDEGNDS